MAIAGASIGMATNRVMEQVNLNVLGKTKDMAQQQATDLIANMVPPAPSAGSVGSIIDVYA